MTLIRCAEGFSAARSFIQLASRRYYATTTSSTTPLDFLAPRAVAESWGPQPSRASPRFTLRTTRSGERRLFNVTLQPKPFQRSFMASAILSYTKCVQKPLKDEEGNDMMLEITPRAAKRLSEIMVKDNNPNLALRIQVESGGCHGFQYLMSLITIPAKDAQEWSSVVSEEDSIFQYIPDDRSLTTVPKQSPTIILDEPSLDLLKGSKVDFTMELIGSQFKIVDNPYASSSCGCGTSFDIKM